MTSWPPDYKQELSSRVKILQKISKDNNLAVGAISYYSPPAKWAQFINDWMVTYDPRNTNKTDTPTIIPFVLFQRQVHFVEFVIKLWQAGESGLVEKCRDMGATWLCCAISVCLWLFAPGSSIGWGSRKEQLVDKIGDPDSIFEKIRIILKYLPPIFMPPGWNPKTHDNYMKIINPANGNTITGEAGDNIGRGGRKSIFFKDESAHYEHPDLIEAALGDNTNVQVDISSVNGTANVFARKRQAGRVWNPGDEIKKGGRLPVFIFDWRDHPNKTQEWYDRRRKRAEREGLLHIFAQEVDRDYAAAVENVLIPANWVQSAVDFHIRFPEFRATVISGPIFSGLDVADEGGDLNAQAMRKGVTLIGLDRWAQGDTGQTANRAILNCRQLGAKQLDFDCIGVGAGVKAETNRLKREEKIPKHLEIYPWNAASGPANPERKIGGPASPKNKDIFQNLKAQAGWSLRRRFEKTHLVVTQGQKYPLDELICIPKYVPYFTELIAELSQPTYGQNSAGKIIVNKKPDGTRSPNLFDCVSIAYYPVKPKKISGTW